MLANGFTRVFKGGVLIKTLASDLKFFIKVWKSEKAEGVDDSHVEFSLYLDKKFEIPVKARGVLGVNLSETFPYSWSITGRLVNRLEKESFHDLINER